MTVSYARNLTGEEIQGLVQCDLTRIKVHPHYPARVRRLILKLVQEPSQEMRFNVALPGHDVYISRVFVPGYIADTALTRRERKYLGDRLDVAPVEDGNFVIHVTAPN